MLQGFYGSLCVRAGRRTLVAYCRANAMFFSDGARALFLPTVAPLCKFLRTRFLAALEARLESTLKRVRTLALACNVPAARGDGNYELASRIAVHGRYPSGRRILLRPYTAMHGLSGTDGTRFKPVEAMEIEDWAHTRRDMRPMIEEHMQARLAAGIPKGGVPVVAHTTVTYGKHRR